jgi:sulfatase modifying factor 1
MKDRRGNGCGVGDKAWSVGSKAEGVSPYGALDMAGNVSEMVADWYAGDYYSRSPASNPQGPDSGDYHVRRGGSWGDLDVRSASRLWGNPDSRNYIIGFRCAVSMSSPGLLAKDSGLLQETPPPGAAFHGMQ